MSHKPYQGNIELHINELVLHDFPHHERHRIGEAIKQELVRQLSETGIPNGLSKGGNISRINAGSIQTPRGTKAERIGVQVAQAVYGSVTGGQQPRRGRQQSSAPVNTQTNHNGSIKQT